MSKRKSNTPTNTPRKKVKMTASSEKDDSGKKLDLTKDWTRTHPVTGKKGKLHRLNTEYSVKQQARRKQHIESKKKSKKKNNNDDDDDDDMKETIKITGNEEYHELTTRFNQHVCVVTGGGRGVGQAIALRLAQEGGNVYVLDKFRWQETVNLLNDAYGDKKHRCKGFRCDVTDLKQIKKVIKQIIDKHGYIDVLVNAVTEADNNNNNKKPHEYDSNDILKSFDINFFSMYNVSKIVIPHMLKEKYGRIVSIASTHGKEGKEGQFAYSLTTAATINATKTMGKEYAGTGITVNCVAPVVDYQVTKMGKQKEAKKFVPMGRAAEEGELAGLVAFIASEENTYTTGFCYDLTGGVVV